MKKILFFVAFCFTALFANNAMAGVGCTIDTSTCTSLNTLGYGKICPGTLPAATAGTPYSAQNTFQIPASFVLNTTSLGLNFGPINVSITNVIVTVTGLPAGLTATFDNGTGVYNPGSNPAGCVVINGTPCDNAATYQVSINYTVTANYIGITLQLPFALANTIPLTLNSTYPVLAINAPLKSLCGTGAGASETLTATAGFGTYNWNYNNSYADTLAINTAHNYKVTVKTADSACVFKDSVNILSLSAKINGNDTTICKGSFLPLSTNNYDTIVWSPAVYLSNRNGVNNVVLRTLPSTTDIKLFVTNGYCTDSSFLHVTVDTTCKTACGACTVNSSGCTGAAPKLCSNFPAATAGQHYDQAVTFFLPDTLLVSSVINIPITIPGLPTKFALDNAQIVIDSLPTGLSYNTDQAANQNRYVPIADPTEQYGCLHICGATCVTTWNTKINARVELPANLKAIVKSLKSNPLISGFLGNLDTIVNVPLSTSFPVNIANPLALTATHDTIVTGQSDTVKVTANYAAYLWTRGSTAQSIVIDSAGNYCVTVTDSAGCTQSACKTVVALTGINDLADIDGSLNVYPNPNNGLFNLTFTMKNNQTISTQVFDIAGKVVYQNTFTGNRGTNKATLQLNNAAKGVYLLKVTTADGTVNRRITIE